MNWITEWLKDIEVKRINKDLSTSLKKTTNKYFNFFCDKQLDEKGKIEFYIFIYTYVFNSMGHLIHILNINEGVSRYNSESNSFVDNNLSLKKFMESDGNCPDFSGIFGFHSARILDKNFLINSELLFYVLFINPLILEEPSDFRKEINQEQYTEFTKMIKVLQNGLNEELEMMTHKISKKMYPKIFV